MAKRLGCPTNTGISLLQCLRSKNLKQLMKESAEMVETGYSSSHSLSAPSLSGISLPVWSPSYDGVVVHSFVHRMGDFLERMSRYQLLYGVATADAANLALNEKQLRFGLDFQVPFITRYLHRFFYCPSCLLYTSPSPRDRG